MGPIRRWILAGIVMLVSCEPGFAPHIRLGLQQGRDRTIEWVSEAATPDVSMSSALALTYLERLRLGMGSPFRLVDQAMHDPRLSVEVRRDVAWAILGRTLARDAYAIDAAAAGIVTGYGSPEQHVALIEETIALSSDPRTGERAVRMAYTRAADAGTVPAAMLPGAARVAALVRDRELARLDVIRLLESAGESFQDPLEQLSVWRAERRFDVEAPALAWRAPDRTDGAARLAGPIEGLLRDLTESKRLATDLAASKRLATDLTEPKRQAPRSGRSDLPGDRLLTDLPESKRQAPRSGRSNLPGDRPLIDRPATNDPAREQTGSVVSEHAARRVAALSLAENPAPRAPVTVSVSSTRAALLLDSTIDAEIRSARERFLRNAVSEESFVAEHALLRAAEGEADVVAKAAVNVAIALRAYAQEPVWFPGFTASSADAVAGRNGLQEIRFANAIPDSWQPYYLRMIDLALADLKSVLPGLDLEGLRIEIGYAGIRPGMLALHDPRRNRLILPPETGAGAIAHEIAHHLDGQVASRRYGLRGDYASDGALRAARDGLATHFVDLAHATDGPRAAGSSSPHASRPAEIFARSVEWFVAEALAGTGRSNGYLTSVQDDMLRGFGSARPLASDGNAAEALTLVLDEVAPLDPMTRYAFLARYGRTTAPEGPHAEPSAPARTLALQPAPGLGTPSTAAVDLPKVTEVPSANRPAPNGRE